MLSAETSALVAGGMRAPAAAAAQPVTVRVLRAVMWGGQRVEVGAELTVDRLQAAELVTAGKAERVAVLPAAAPAPTAAAAPKPAPRARAA